MDPELRVVSPEDWHHLKAVRLRALADSPDAFGSLYADAVALDDDAWRARASSPGATIVALNGDDAVGMGGLFAPDSAPEVFVWGMWVAPEWRGRGLGRRILHELIGRAVGLGRPVVLHVTEGNVGARRLYESHGFVPTGHWQPLREGSPLQVEELRRPPA